MRVTGCRLCAAMRRFAQDRHCTQQCSVCAASCPIVVHCVSIVPNCFPVVCAFALVPALVGAVFRFFRQTFQSGVWPVGSTPHLALTWAVAILIILCCIVLGLVLGREVVRSLQVTYEAKCPVHRSVRPPPQPLTNTFDCFVVLPSAACRFSGIAFTWQYAKQLATVMASAAPMAESKAGAGTARRPSLFDQFRASASRAVLRMGQGGCAPSPSL